MQAIILCGGRGTRLSQLYADRPKVLAPVAAKPFLDWQLAWLARNGIRQIHLAAGHLADVLQQWVSTHASVYPELNFSLSVETSPLGTGGGLKFVEPFVTSDPFLVLNGDSLMPNLDFAGLFHAHQTTGVPVTIAVTRIEEAGRYGTVEFDAQNRITAFLEKTERREGWINGGVYLMNREVLAQIPETQNVSMETEVFPRLVAGQLLAAFPAAPPLLDMGTPEGIQSMEKYLRASV